MHGMTVCEKEPSAMFFVREDTAHDMARKGRKRGKGSGRRGEGREMKVRKRMK